MYEYRGICNRVIDGDTLELLLDLGFGTHRVDRFRLLGINTAEVNAKSLGERAHAQEAIGFVSSELFDPATGPKTLSVRTTKDKTDKYGRYLAEVWVGGELDSLNDKLRANGFQKKERYEL